MWIFWRVLTWQGLKQQSRDRQGYYALAPPTITDVTWETCTLRTWLNDTFLNKAFTSDEQSAIISTTITNEKNSNSNTAGGNTTTDKIYLLSETEVKISNYGFSTSDTECDDARQAVATAYAYEQGVYEYNDSDSNADYYHRLYRH